MSALIKFGADPAVRALTLGAVQADPPPPDPRNRMIGALEAEVAGLIEACALSEARAREAAAQAYAEGHAAGLTEAEDREADRLAALRDTLDAAGAAFTDRLALVEGLAPQLARASLAKLFGTVETWTPMVEATLIARLRTLRQSNVVAIRVSPDDFDANAARALATGALQVEIDPELPPGASRIECRLGQIDLDMPRQWAVLSDLLDEMARGQTA